MSPAHNLRYVENARKRGFRGLPAVHFLLAALLSVVLIQSGCVGLTGAASSGTLSFDPARMDFGDVPTGNKKTETVILTNTGETPLTIPQATLAGANFSLAELELPATLEPGETLTFTASFAPTVTGEAAGTIVVSSEDSSIPPASLALAGMGLSASGPTITAQPANQTVVLGQSANFSVTASGTGELKRSDLVHVRHAANHAWG
jgi:hypothetical protein